MKLMTDSSGHFAGGVHFFQVRVYYEDTDFSGAVYHANYLKFCERGRSEALRIIGVHHHEMDDSANFVVRSMACNFLKPATIDDLLTVESHFKEFAGARMEMMQQVLRGEDILFSADVTIALVSDQGRPMRIPAGMAEAFNSVLKRGG
jgi:acyl-CoA thioester hydrolase